MLLIVYFNMSKTFYFVLLKVLFLVLHKELNLVEIKSLNQSFVYKIFYFSIFNTNIKFSTVS